jgi:hypothetical protein
MITLVAGDQAISNFLEGYELVVDLWKYMNRRDDKNFLHKVLYRLGYKLLKWNIEEKAEEGV